jgi:hypothetical protein
LWKVESVADYNAFCDAREQLVADMIRTLMTDLEVDWAGDL